MKPVTRTRGKRSAVATPTLAVWAARRRSAAWTSGRRRSRSDASPIGRAAISGVTSASGHQHRVQLARPLADQDAQPVVGALLGGDQGGITASVALRRAWALATSIGLPAPAS
jgi:hypothetical protein